jgi:hypothetical protein
MIPTRQSVHESDKVVVAQINVGRQRERGEKRETERVKKIK